MTGLIWDTVAIIFAVFCLLITVGLTCIALAFCYSVIRAIREQIKKKGKGNNHDAGNN